MMENINNFIDPKDNPLVIAGPCVIEDFEEIYYIAEYLRNSCQENFIPFLFKASFDKANRTSIDSYRGINIDDAVKLFLFLKEKLNINITTDIHEPWQAEVIAEAVDVIQIPAFLSRQTDLLLEAGRTGKVINIKKGQFMSPYDMEYAVNKVRTTNNDNIFLTERGTFFGYGDLVVDFRSIIIMKEFASVVFDATHSVQRPSVNNGVSGGNKEFSKYLINAAISVGVDGIFMEIHPDPKNAKSDSATQLPLNEFNNILKDIIKFNNTALIM